MANVRGGGGGTAGGGGLDDMSAMLKNLPEDNDPVENWVILWQAIELCRELIKHQEIYGSPIVETDIVKLHALALHYRKRIAFDETEKKALQDCIDERSSHAFVWKFMAFCENMHQFICNEQKRLYVQQQSQAPSHAELFASKYKVYLKKLKRHLEVEQAAMAYLEAERAESELDANTRVESIAKRIRRI